jgi:hypothetical protein
LLQKFLIVIHMLNVTKQMQLQGAYTTNTNENSVLATDERGTKIKSIFR